jgi:Kdo2-lipid IVA lauroyltransferase/acyltransferase
LKVFSYIVQILASIAAILAACLFFLLPFPLLYILSDVFCFLLQNVFRYRRKVVLSNLRNSFSNKNDEQIRKLYKSFYQNLADIAVESIKGFTLTKKQIIRRHRVTNPEVINPFYEKQQSVIILAAHYGNWEWGSYSGSLQFKHKNVALYKPLNNFILDRLLIKSRSRCGTHMASIQFTQNTFEEFKLLTTAYILVADQSPSDITKAVWVDFLNTETACLHGPEKYSHLYNLPLIYADIQRVKRGYYELELSVLAEDPAKLPAGMVTRLYMQKLETVITKKPEDWLWSHRRWKIKRPAIN